MNDFDEKTRVTQVVQPPPGSGGPKATTDCLVVIYTKEPTLLGKRFVLEHNSTRVGRGADNHIVLDGDSVSRRHAHFEQRAAAWLVVDLGSTNGTTVDGHRIDGDGDEWTTLHGGAVVKLAGVSVVAAFDTAGTVHLQGLTSR